MRNIEEIQEIEKTVGTNRFHFWEYCFLLIKSEVKVFLMRCGHQPFCKKYKFEKLFVTFLFA